LRTKGVLYNNAKRILEFNICFYSHHECYFIQIINMAFHTLCIVITNQRELLWALLECLDVEVGKAKDGVNGDVTVLQAVQ
jgi:hypothetical protein